MSEHCRNSVVVDRIKKLLFVSIIMIMIMIIAIIIIIIIIIIILFVFCFAIRFSPRNCRPAGCLFLVFSVSSYSSHEQELSFFCDCRFWKQSWIS